IDLGVPPVTGQLTRLRGTLQRAGEDALQGELLQPRAELAGMFLAALVQRDIGAAGVLARLRPGRVPVPGEGQSLPFPWHWIGSSHSPPAPERNTVEKATT